jgi:hypothetical protein
VDKNSAIVAAGSLFVTAAVREIWQDNNQILGKESMENR